jgi:polyhydroxybutyrate depolymerase
MIRTLAPLLFAAVLSIAAATADTSEISFEQDGLTRNFLLTIPDGLTGPAPLVLAVHGLLEDSSSMRERLARGRLDVFAAEFGFVVAYPSAWGRVWNIGEGPGASRILPRRDDLAYLLRVLADSRARAEIDPSRIFIVGFSQGGMISLSLACKFPGIFRAVAVVASQMPEMLADDCAENMPDGVLLIHGTDDDVVPYEGGRIISGPLARMRLKSYSESLAYFISRKGCAAAPSHRRWDAKPDNTSVERLGWYDCDDGGAVEGYAIIGGGHRWPSGGPIQPVAGATTREIDGTAAVWGFFSRFE